jgi:hypothetical protein
MKYFGDLSLALRDYLERKEYGRDSEVEMYSLQETSFCQIEGLKLMCIFLAILGKLDAGRV